MHCHQEGPGVCGDATDSRRSEEEARPMPEDTGEGIPRGRESEGTGEGGGGQGEDPRSRASYGATP